MENSDEGGGKTGRPRDVSNPELLGHIRSIEKERFTLKEVRDASPFSSRSGTLSRLNEFVEIGLLTQHDLGKGNPNQYSLNITEEDIIGALNEVDQNASDEDVAKVLDCDLRAALTWLRMLEGEGVLGSKPVGGGERVWSLANVDG